jgi:hypothetical protein
MKHWKPDFEAADALPLILRRRPETVGEKLQGKVEKLLEDPIDRREALSTLGHAALGTTVGITAKKVMAGQPEAPASEKKNEFAGVKPKVTEASLPRQESLTPLAPGEYRMGKLSGEKVGKLFSLYFGLKEGDAIPEVLKIDFQKVLNTAYQKKVKLLEEKYEEDTAEIQKLHTHYQKFFAREEAQQEKRSVSDLEKIGQEQVSALDTLVDWNKFQNIPQYKNFSDNEVKLLRYLARVMNGKMLLAYSLTELMPSAENFTKNIRVYEFLAQNDPRILLAWPSLGDSKKSAGPYQFTRGAVGISKAGEKNGALIINQLLPPNEKIPAELENLLSFSLQMRAAQLFVINNLAQLMFRIRKNEAKKNDRLLQLVSFLRSGNKEEMLSFVASAHNNPHDAITAFVSWLDADRRGQLGDFVEETEGYITKSQGNYQALKKYE